MASTVHDTIIALYTLWKEALPSDVWVVDGPAVGNDGATRFVSVGYDGNEGAALMEVSPAGFDADPDRETYTVYCCVVSMTGDDDQPAARADAFSLYDSCCQALSLDRTLGGTVLRAMPAEVTVRQSAHPGGRDCRISFGVRVEAFTKEA